MLYAHTESQQKITATPGAKGICPLCGGDVIAKCGSIKIWHWSHKQKDCDIWAEPMTQWHIDWQNIFPRECQEISMDNHRADVFWDGCTWEFQNSYIKLEDVQARESIYRNYGNMLWVFNAAQWELYQMKTIAKNYSSRVRPDILEALRKERPGWSKKLLIGSVGSDAYESLPLLDNSSLLLPSYVWNNFKKNPTEVQIGNFKCTLPTIKTWFKWNWAKPSLLNCKNQIILDINKGNYWHTKSLTNKIKNSTWIENSLLFVVDRIEKRTFIVDVTSKEFDDLTRTVEGTVIIGLLLEKTTLVEKLSSSMEDKK